VQTVIIAKVVEDSYWSTSA